MITTNKNTEEELDLIIMEAIGLAKGSLQTYDNNLQEFMLNDYFTPLDTQFFNIKMEITTFVNSLEENLIIPMQNLLLQNYNSKYKFAMMELCSRLDPTFYRDELGIIENSDDGIDIQTKNLWKLAQKIANEVRIMLTISDCRIAEIVPQPYF